VRENFKNMEDERGRRRVGDGESLRERARSNIDSKEL
jgi:hypothetical protein